MASTSRARATFRSELIERSTEDDLPDYVKGVVVYKSFSDQEGYYVFDKDLQGYLPVHFLEDKRLWVLIDYDSKVGSWYTTEPAPLSYRLGPYRNVHRIDVDLSEGELADTEDPTDKGKQPVTTPQIFTPYAMTSTQAQTTTTAPTTTSGGGGGGGGAPTGPPALTGKLGGNPPKEFHRD